MRALTDAEVRVIAVLLAAAPDRERERLKRIGIPRSTYHAARRRAYEEGWLRDRYIPDPSRFGWPEVTFVLARPFLDREEELVELWKSDPGVVLLWSSRQLLLGVGLHERGEALRFERLLERPPRASAHVAVTAELTEASVPVYFDFEGLWAHLSGLTGTVAYPHGLGGQRDRDADPDPAVTPHLRWALGELLHRPYTANSDGKSPHLVGPLGLPFSQQRLLTKGWVTHRVLLEPSRLPSYRGRSADQAYFISGRLREGVRAEELFAQLTRECWVFPFLFVVSPERVLLGALGSGSPVAPDPALPGPRRPVMTTLRGSLEGIEVVQEAIGNFEVHVDHRYEQLLGPGGDVSVAGAGKRNAN